MSGIAEYGAPLHVGISVVFSEVTELAVQDVGFLLGAVYRDSINIKGRDTLLILANILNMLPKVFAIGFPSFGKLFWYLV